MILCTNDDLWENELSGEAAPDRDLFRWTNVGTEADPRRKLFLYEFFFLDKANWLTLLQSGNNLKDELAE